MQAEGKEHEIKTAEIVFGVMDLFPGADRQALTCLAELLEKRIAELTAERDKARRYCSGAAYDMAGFAETLKESPEALSQAERDVLSECRRQVEEEGWTAEHDDQHSGGEMAGAAACYALYRSHVAVEDLMGGDFVETTWPWAPHWWKPKDRRRDLVRSASLLIKEIERLDRASANNGGA